MKNNYKLSDLQVKHAKYNSRKPSIHDAHGLHLNVDVLMNKYWTYHCKELCLNELDDHAVLKTENKTILIGKYPKISLRKARVMREKLNIKIIKKNKIVKEKYYLSSEKHLFNKYKEGYHKYKELYHDKCRANYQKNLRERDNIIIVKKEEVKWLRNYIGFIKQRSFIVGQFVLRVKNRLLRKL